MPVRQQLVPQDKLSHYLRTPHIIPHPLTTHLALTTTIHTSLPHNYNFEIHKVIWRILCVQAKVVVLQMPEGLLMYSCIIADILTQYTGADCIIQGDVVYGACCVDDISAKALGADLLVHYGHSCLVSNEDTTCNTMYVFVTIDIDVQHLIDTITYNFTTDTTAIPHSSNNSSVTAADDSKLYDQTDVKQVSQYDITIGGTIQFTNSIQRALPPLRQHYGAANIHMPQCTPLSAGETLGCTSSKLDVKQTDDKSVVQVLVFVADGRFHLESLMIQNPHIQHVYKYDPYNKTLTYEVYGHEEMYGLRQTAIDVARRSLLSTAAQTPTIGIILGTLGRQGSTHLLTRVQRLCDERGVRYVTVLLSEVQPSKLALMSDIAFWVQIACPRLSIDWGHAFAVPLLTTYECDVLMGESVWQSVYPMDYYSKEGGSWSSYAHKQDKGAAVQRTRKKAVMVEYEDDGDGDGAAVR